MKEEKHKRGAARYLRVDTDEDILEFQLPIANNVLTFKPLNPTIFIPQKSKNDRNSVFPPEMYLNHGGKVNETGFTPYGTWKLSTGTQNNDICVPQLKVVNFFGHLG